MTRLNIADAFLTEQLREGRAERVAIHSAEGTFGYGAVNALADLYGHGLREAGVRREERVFLAMPDGVEFVGAFFGILKLGAVVVMINPDLAQERIAELIELCEPSAAVVGPGLADLFRGAAPERSLPLVTPGGNGDVVIADIDDTTPLESVPTHRDDPAIWLFSGGSTGVPKAVVQTHRSYLNTTVLYAQETLGYHEDDVTMSIPKLYFGYATGSNLLFPFSVGASSVLFPQHPTAEIVFDVIARFRPTILINVPTMIAKMVSHPSAGSQDLSCLRFASSAGEPLPVELYRSWKDLFGVELLDGLGTAEMWHVFVTNRLGDVKPGTLGKPVAGFDIRICDPEGEPVPEGDVGQLWVKGDSRAIGYWRDMDRTATAFRGPWFVGGDLVRRDEEGYIEHHGRTDDRLKVGGKWLSPQEVESCLLEHDAVDLAVVVGVPNPDGLIKPVAFIVPAERRKGLETDLMTWVLERLDPYKHPRRIHVVDTMPLTHLGKVDRTRLREMAEGGC